MKSILLVRHCKSDWNQLGLNDHDRALNERGKRDLPKISARLSQIHTSLQKLYFSSANRAATTAKGIISGWPQKLESEKKTELYTFSAEDVLNFITNLPESESEIGIVAHNPGLTDLINEMTHIRLDNLPTGGFCLILFDVSSWKEIANCEGEIKFLEYPKIL